MTGFCGRVERGSEGHKPLFVFSPRASAPCAEGFARWRRTAAAKASGQEMTKSSTVVTSIGLAATARTSAFAFQNATKPRTAYVRLMPRKRATVQTGWMVPSHRTSFGTPCLMDFRPSSMSLRGLSIPEALSLDHLASCPEERGEQRPLRTDAGEQVAEGRLADGAETKMLPEGRR